MRFGFTNLSIIPVRAEANERSEMVTQLLFGDLYQIISVKKKWIQIKIDSDSYEGFIDQLMFFEIDAIEHERLKNIKPIHNANLISNISTNSELINIVQGSRLPIKEKNIFSVNKQTYKCENYSQISQLRSKNKIKQTALSYLNSPYLWGGKTHFGIDCSGFTQMVYRINGIEIPRNASQQVLLGEPRNFIDEAEIGDLAFFDNKDGDVIHVGIIIGNNSIIHASGKVRIDHIDHQGIYNQDLKKYTHKLRVVQKFI